MEPILFAALVAWAFTRYGVTDLISTIKGTPSPRQQARAQRQAQQHQREMARIQAGRGPTVTEALAGRFADRMAGQPATKQTSSRNRGPARQYFAGWWADSWADADTWRRGHRERGQAGQLWRQRTARKTGQWGRHLWDRLATGRDQAAARGVVDPPPITPMAPSNSAPPVVAAVSGFGVPEAEVIDIELAEPANGPAAPDGDTGLAAATAPASERVVRFADQIRIAQPHPAQPRVLACPGCHAASGLLATESGELVCGDGCQTRWRDPDFEADAASALIDMAASRPEQASGPDVEVRMSEAGKWAVSTLEADREELSSDARPGGPRPDQPPAIEPARGCDYTIIEDRDVTPCNRPAVGTWHDGDDEYFCAAHMGDPAAAAELGICPTCCAPVEYDNRGDNGEPGCGSCGHVLDAPPGAGESPTGPPTSPDSPDTNPEGATNLMSGETLDPNAALSFVQGISNAAQQLQVELETSIANLTERGVSGEPIAQLTQMQEAAQTLIGATNTAAQHFNNHVQIQDVAQSDSTLGGGRYIGIGS